MNLRIKTFMSMALLSVLGATTANAQGVPVVNPETGHYYRVVQTGPITWEAANGDVNNPMLTVCLDPFQPPQDPEAPQPPVTIDCAETGAVKPHLATLTSSREEVFVDGLRDDVVGDGMRGANGNVLAQTWIGGIQDGLGTDPATTVVEPYIGWRWVNNEGAFPGVNGGTVYTNWNPAEPNNSGGEDHLALGRYGYGLGWNDEAQNRGSIVGYIVEWDVPLPAAECLADDVDSGGCTTVVGQTLAFPTGSNPNNANISFNSFELLDPRVAAGTCGTETLEIFGDTGIGAAPGIRPEMRIPSYLCGSPRFVVVAVNSSELVIETGTVGVKHDTVTVLPGNVYPDGGVSVCEDPIFQNPYTDGDPQYQDVVVWQTTDPANMLEDDLGGTEGYPGATGEFTNECGTSRARVKGASYFGIGFHIDFGPGNTWVGNSGGNFDSFVALTRYKLTLLQRSLADAVAESPSAILKKADRNKMTNQVANAIKNLDDGNYSGAHDHIVNFLKFVLPANYREITGENYEGEHLMRGSNIEFMLRVKVIPYAPPVLP